MFQIDLVQRQIPTPDIKEAARQRRYTMPNFTASRGLRSTSNYALKLQYPNFQRKQESPNPNSPYHTYQREDEE